MVLCTFLLRKIHKNVATRAALYGSNMHQIVCRTQLGELTALPRGRGLGSPGEGRKRREGERERKEKGGKREGRRGRKGKGRGTEKGLGMPPPPI